MEVFRPTEETIEGALSSPGAGIWPRSVTWCENRFQVSLLGFCWALGKFCFTLRGKAQSRTEGSSLVVCVPCRQIKNDGRASENAMTRSLYKAIEGMRCSQTGELSKMLKTSKYL